MKNTTLKKGKAYNVSNNKISDVTNNGKKKKSLGQYVTRMMLILQFLLIIMQVSVIIDKNKAIENLKQDVYALVEVAEIARDNYRTSSEHQRILSYNDGYRNGMLYAYDNVVVCGASPELEGMKLASFMGILRIESSISCVE